MVPDLPTTIVTVAVNGRTKKVEDYVAAPDSLAEFEREIDAAGGTKRSVFLDEDALEELARSGRLASGEEGAAFLKQAIERDDVAIARRLIKRGSDLDGPPNNRLPPLLSARSSSMVDLLVKAGLRPRTEASTRGESAANFSPGNGLHRSAIALDHAAVHFGRPRGLGVVVHLGVKTPQQRSGERSDGAPQERSEPAKLSASGVSGRSRRPRNRARAQRRAPQDPAAKRRASDCVRGPGTKSPDQDWLRGPATGGTCSCGMGQLRRRVDATLASFVSS